MLADTRQKDARQRECEMNATATVLAILLGCGFNWVGTGSEDSARLVVKDSAILQLNRPSGVAFIDDDHLLVASSDDGTLAIVNVDSESIVNRIQIGSSLTDLVCIGRTQRFLTVDSGRHEIVEFAVEGGAIRVISRHPTARYPLRAAVSPDANRVSVTGHWSRRVSLIELADRQQAGSSRSPDIDLPFCPREQIWIDQETLLVADGFGGQMALIDTRRRRIDRVFQTSFHNFGGFAVDRERSELVVTYQVLNHLARTVRNDVHWGMVISNEMQRVPVDRFKRPAGNPFAQLVGTVIGGAGSGKADPGHVEMLPGSLNVLLLGGVDQLAITDPSAGIMNFVDVGARPTALAVNENGSAVAVVNSLDHSISLVDLKSRRRTKTISLGPGTEPGAVERGERLFFAAELSHDNWMSCHSCHTNGHTNGGLNDNFSDGSFGAPKRVLSLLGHANTEPFAWDGSFASLHGQLANTIEKTMQSGSKPDENQVADLVEFLRSLAPPPSILDARDEWDNRKIARGRELFGQLDCVRCHLPPAFTSAELYDVGVRDRMDNREFNPPSLIGVGQRDRLFHDGSVFSLKSLLVEHRHQIDEPLNQSELDDLLAFLRSI